MPIDVALYYEKYGPMVLRRCRFLLKDEDHALDAMQEVFVKVLQKKNTLRDDYPSSLLYRIATNVCLNMIRSQNRKPEAQIGDMLFEIASYDDTAEKLAANELIDSIFSSEKKSTRNMAVMYYIDEMTFEQISEEVGLSVSGVRKRLMTLQKKVQVLREIND